MRASACRAADLEAKLKRATRTRIGLLSRLSQIPRKLEQVEYRRRSRRSGPGLRGPIDDSGRRSRVGPAERPGPRRRLPNAVPASRASGPAGDETSSEDRMTTLEVPGAGPGFGVFSGDRSASLRGRWTLIPGGTAETHPAHGPLALLRTLAPWHPRTVTMPLLSGALQIGEPVHATVGEIAVAVDKTRSVRLTVADLTALG